MAFFRVWSFGEALQDRQDLCLERSGLALLFIDLESRMSSPVLWPSLTINASVTLQPPVLFLLLSCMSHW